MKKSAIITKEEVDDDVCLGDYDGVRSSYLYVVEYFDDDTRVDTSYHRDPDDAQEAAEMWL